MLSAALSAFANSGGGHILLGVEDDGTLTGIPAFPRGRTSAKDWLEQLIPELVSYPLSDFRIHTVEPSESSQIEAGRVVCVVDIGDSALCPHQAKDGKYYHRTGSRSVPASHFYLELLRQRTIAPRLTARLEGVVLNRVVHVGSDAVVRVRFQATIHNVGSVAAYKWALAATGYSWSGEDVVPGFEWGRGEGYTSMRKDDTLLPGCRLLEEQGFACRLVGVANDPSAAEQRLREVILSLKLNFRLATEVSAGEPVCIEIGPLVDVARWANEIAEGRASQRQ